MQGSCTRAGEPDSPRSGTAPSIPGCWQVDPYLLGDLAEGRIPRAGKTVQRWIAGDVTPYPRTRYRVAAVLAEDESYLWPQAVNHAALAGAELAATWPRRCDVPAHTWTELLRAAGRNVDVLAFAGLFLTEEHSGWLPALAEKAASGTRIRLLLGDPAGTQVAARDREHFISRGVAGRVAAVLGYYRQMPEAVELRLHDTPLYNSVYRFDDEMLVNVHAYGILAAYTPVMHLRRVDGAFFNTYIESFERGLGIGEGIAGRSGVDAMSKTRGGKPKARTDYWDDPGAPPPTSRKPSASVVLRNHAGELLLRRADTGRWTIPTGGLKKNETMSACAIRECREETGLAVELTGLAGVFSDPRHRIAFPDGEVRVPVNVCFYGQPIGGELHTDSESTLAAWVRPEDLDGYDIHPAILRRISHALHGTGPHVD